MAATNREFTATEVKAGMMVLVSAAVFIGFFALVSGWRPQAEVKTFYARFPDTGGLNKGAYVRYGGKIVGRVSDIALDPENQSLILVVLDVGADTPVNAGSTCFITQTTLTSERHVEITTGDPLAALLDNGVEIPAKPGGLFGAVDKVANSLALALEDMRALLGAPRLDASGNPAEGEEEPKTVADIFRSVDDAVVQGGGAIKDLRNLVAENEANVGDIVQKVKDIQTSAQDLVDRLDGIVKSNEENISATLANARALSDDAAAAADKLAARIDSLADSLEAILTNAKLLSQDAQGLVEDHRPVIEDVLLDLRETVRYVKEFSRTIAEQPQSVVRGTRAQGRPAE